MMCRCCRVERIALLSAVQAPEASRARFAYWRPSSFAVNDSALDVSSHHEPPPDENMYALSVLGSLLEHDVGPLERLPVGVVLGQGPVFGVSVGESEQSPSVG